MFSVMSVCWSVDKRNPISPLQTRSLVELHPWSVPLPTWRLSRPVQTFSLEKVDTFPSIERSSSWNYFALHFVKWNKFFFVPSSFIFLLKSKFVIWLLKRNRAKDFYASFHYLLSNQKYKRICVKPRKNMCVIRNDSSHFSIEFFISKKTSQFIFVKFLNSKIAFFKKNYLFFP